LSKIFSELRVHGANNRKAVNEKTPTLKACETTSFPFHSQSLF